jgi:hypothetical protein
LLICFKGIHNDSSFVLVFITVKHQSRIMCKIFNKLSYLFASFSLVCKNEHFAL